MICKLTFRFLFTSFFVSLFSLSIHAQNTSSNTSSGQGSGNKGGFSFAIGAFDSMGTMKNQTGTIVSRSMNNIGISAQPSYSFGLISALLYADYVVTGQVTEPSEVSNTNLGGSGWIAGPGVGFGFSKIDLAVSYILYGTYTTTKKTALGEETSYSKPSGFVVNLGYALSPPWSLRLIFRSIGYGKAIVGSSNTDIKDDMVSNVSYGLGISASF